MRSLYVRLTLVFLVILLALGVFCLWLAQSSAEARSLELTQRLNESVARYMVETRDFADASGLRGEALAELAPHVMMINPSVEVYLLDPTGAVVAQASTLNTIAPTRVDLGPVKRFVAGETRYPLLGDDPLSTGTLRPFSAWPVHHQDKLHGYVYAVLAGRPYASLREALGSSRSLLDLAVALSSALLLAAIAGILVFYMLTRRLRKLTARIDQLPADSKQARTKGRDEIDELAEAYNALTARLQSQYTRLEKSDASRRALVASVSHDLRTPLTTLKGYIETLQLGENQLSSEQRVRYLAIARRHADELGERVEELFELSRLSAAGASLTIERFSLRELAHDCLQDFEPLARERSIETVVVTDDPNGTHPFAIEADIALLQRVFENLIGNALRYTAEGGRIAVRLGRTEQRDLWIEVLDNGCGIAPEMAPRVFESCWSGDGDDRSRGGLGLAIAARAVELHGGRIEVASTPGVGTRFRIELPGPSNASSSADASRRRESTRLQYQRGERLTAS